MLVPVKCYVLAVTLLIISSTNEVQGARILGIFPHPGKSHMIVNSALMKELASRGHQVTVLSTTPEETSIQNYTDLEIKLSVKEVIKEALSDSSSHFDLHSLNYVQSAIMMWKLGSIFCDRILQEEALQRLIHSEDQKFDLLIMEAYGVDCLYGFAHKFKVPVVYISTFVGTSSMGDMVGNPSPYAYVPDPLLNFSDRMNFWERIQNTLAEVFQQLGRRFYYIPRQEAVIRKHFNDKNAVSTLSELHGYTSLILVNSHFTIGYPKPHMPNMIQVGGMHLKDPKILPDDIRKFIEGAEHGVVYFSLGTHFQSSEMSEETVNEFLKAFSRLQQKVLWKWEADSLPKQPKNVKLGKWLPQSDILAHPNVRLFITHCGMMSTQETMDRGVPIVGIPIHGDQKRNMARLESAGIGVQLDFHNITAESIVLAVTKVLESSSYRENAQRQSQIFRDQPLKPLEQAVFWTEYVIRHKGAPHMRSAALDLYWYQHFLLDVIALLALAAVSIILITKIILGVIFKKVCSGKSREPNAKSKRKKRD